MPQLPGVYPEMFEFHLCFTHFSSFMNMTHPLFLNEDKIKEPCLIQGVRIMLSVVTRLQT
jgi:hypothetical protein